MRDFINKRDFFIILGLLILGAFSLGFILYNSKAVYSADIYYDTNLAATIDLSHDRIFELSEILPNSPYMKFEVKGGGIRVLESSCPDKICINMGVLSHSSEMIVCLPNRVYVRVSE